MSELLKRADNFNCHSDGTSGKNPADAKLVSDLADRVRELEHRITFAVEFVSDGKAGDAAVSWDAQLLIDKLAAPEVEVYDQKKMDRKYPFFTMDPKKW